MSTDVMDIQKEVEALGREAREALARASDTATIAAWHHDYLSKKGKSSLLKKGIGAIKDIEQKRAAARSETMFHQIEGLAVGHNITFADLKSPGRGSTCA